MTEPTTSAPTGPDSPGSGGRRGMLTAALLGAAGLGVAGAAKALSMGVSSPGASVTTTARPGPASTTTAAAPSVSSNLPSSGAPTTVVTSSTGPNAVDLDQSYQRTVRAPAPVSEHLTYVEVDIAPASTVSAAASTSASATTSATATSSVLPVVSATPFVAASTSTAGTTAASSAASSAAGTVASAATSAASATAAATSAAPTAQTTKQSSKPPVVVKGAFSAAAAQAVQPATVFGPAGPLTAKQAQEHLLRRATCGPRPSDRTEIAALGIDAWLERQLNPSSIPDATGDAIAARFLTSGTSIAQVVGASQQYGWNAMFELVQQVIGRQVFSTRQLQEVVVDVLANLVNATVPSDSLWATAADYQYQVVRKNAFGRYRDLLLAAEKHPAMLTYLNNDQSTREHVNENLGRELLELHTVGVGGGYTETDVQNSAKILSGRTIQWDDTKSNYYQFVYQPSQHYVGPVTVMGFTDPNTDATQGNALADRYVSYLANLPSTAARMARKLAVRFVSDAPSDALVAAMAKSYLDNDTQIVPVLRTMFSSVEFWSSVGAKTKRPQQDIVSTCRALDIQIANAAGNDSKEGMADLYWLLTTTDDAPLRRVTPDGYPDVAAAWQGAGQMLKRWGAHRGLAFGWSSGLKPTTFSTQPAPGATVGEWVDGISVALLGAYLPGTARAAIVEFLGMSSTDKVDWHSWEGGYVAALVLDSLYFQAR